MTNETPRHCRERACGSTWDEHQPGRSRGETWDVWGDRDACCGCRRAGGSCRPHLRSQELPGARLWGAQAGTGGRAQVRGLEGSWGQADAAATGPKPSLSGIIILKILHD